MSLIPPPLRECLRALVGGQAPWPLYLWGEPGTGKTCAALVLADHVTTSYFLTASALGALIADSQQERITYPASGRLVYPVNLWDEIAGCSLVVLDELGSRNQVSDHHYECVKKLLDLRVGKPLVVISNLDLEATARLYDDRVASRAGAGTVFHVGGDDLRLKR